MTNMYETAKTWSPFKGCFYDCIYCKPSFQRQAKRQKHNCNRCYRYIPHPHPERLDKIPNAPIVFVCGNGDISFASQQFTEKIIEAVTKHSATHPDTLYYFQSKQPKYFEQFLHLFPKQVILVTTLETNRDEDYCAISRAEFPRFRYRHFLKLNYPRKVLTIEPILDFDLGVFSNWIVDFKPEYVWIGFNSRPKEVVLPEPSEKKVKQLIDELTRKDIRVIGKQLRSLNID